MVLKLAHRFSRRTRKEASWEELLRCGIRGASVEEIMNNLGELFPDEQVLLNPMRMGFRDTIDLWYANGSSKPLLKKIIRFVLKCVKSISGYTLVPSLNLAIKKDIT